MKRKVIFLAVLFLLSQLASASVIQLTTDIETEGVIVGGKTTVNVSIVNTGDESAHNVMLTLLLPDGFESTPVTPGVLKPNQPLTVKFDVSINETAQPGLQPIVLRVNYADANSYPFSTVSARIVTYLKPAPIKVFGRMSQAELSRGENSGMTLSMRNADDRAHNVSVRLYLPQELKTTSEEQVMEVGAKSEASVEFNVSSFGALGGSTYAVFAVMTYVEDGLKHTSVAGNAVRVLGGAGRKSAPSKKTVGENDGPGWMLYVLVASLAVLVAAAVFSKVKEK